MIRASIILVGSALLFGAPAEAGQDKPATEVYVFDTGYGGWTFTISFSKLGGKVDQVRVDGLN